MSHIQKIIERIPGRSASDQDADVVLGLPLESNGKTIYPVFLDPGTQGENGSHPRQIGYLEVSDERSEFTSFEQGSFWPAMLAALTILALFLIWVTWRQSGR